MAKKAQPKQKQSPKPKAKPKPQPKAKPKQDLKTKPKPKPEMKEKTEQKKKMDPALKERLKKRLKERQEQKPKPSPQPAPAPRQKKAAVMEDENTRKERLRRLLIQKREDIIREAKSEIKKFKNGEKRQLVETVMDDGDMSVVDLSEDISLKQLSTHRETLMKIDIALRKLEEGTYGICEECGDEISEERLKIMPFAIYCRDDQERKEIMESLEREGQ